MAEPTNIAQAEAAEIADEAVVYENEFKDAASVEELLAQFAGAVSMCWSSPDKAGEFLSDHVAFHMDEALKRLQDLTRSALAEYVVESAGELAAFFPMFGLPGERAEIIDEIDEEDLDPEDEAEDEDEAEAEQPVTDEE